MAQARCSRAINQREKKRGSAAYSTDRENSVSKIFIISLRLIRRVGKETSQVKRKVQLPQRLPCPNSKIEIFLAVKFETVACKIQTVFSTSYATEMT